MCPDRARPRKSDLRPIDLSICHTRSDMTGTSELSLRPLFQRQHTIFVRAVANPSPLGGIACPGPLIRATVHLRQRLKPRPVQPPLNGRPGHLNSPSGVPNFEHGESPPFRRGTGAGIAPTIRTCQTAAHHIPETTRQSRRIADETGRKASYRSRAEGALSSRSRPGAAIAPAAGIVGSERTGIDPSGTAPRSASSVSNGSIFS